MVRYWLALAALALGCSGSEFTNRSGTGGTAPGGTGATSGSGGSVAGAGGSGATGGTGGSGGAGGASGGTGGATGGTGGATGGTGGATGGTGGATGGTGGGQDGGPSCGTVVTNQCTPLTATQLQAPSSVSGDGCSDGTVEGFVSMTDIAACAGGWSIPGIAFNQNLSPHCNRSSGNSSSNPSGSNCNVEDLCNDGWHVCVDLNEVSSHSSTQGCAAFGAASPGFYITRQAMLPGTTGGVAPDCTTNGVNNLVGCAPGGTIEASPPIPVSCSPLGTWWQLYHCACASIAGWCCNGTTTEAQVVVKNGPFYGGVLCCKN